MKYINKHKHTILIIIGLLVLTIPTVVPLLHKGFFLSDDGEWMIIRFSAFHQALRDGQFPVRFLMRLNHGYGYPVANFLYPGFMYLAEPFKLAGLGFVNAIKLLLGLSMVCSGVFTFFWLRRLFSYTAALLGSFTALYVPYHLYDIYTRGSVGEVLALTLAPFIFWQIERKSFLWTSIGVGLLLLSHNTLAVLLLPLIVLYSCIVVIQEKHEQKFVYQYAGAVGMGFGLSTFFWLPALVELNNTRFSSTTVSDISHYFAQVPLIGVCSLFLFGLALFLVAKKHEDKKLSRLLLLFSLITALSIFYSSSYSTMVWKILPAGFIQFPFRLLSYLVLSVPFVAAFAVTYFTKTARWLIVCFVLLLVIFSAIPYLQPKEFFDKGEAFYATNEDTTTVKNEYMPKWVKKDPVAHPNQKLLISGKLVTNERNTTNKSSFHIEGNGSAAVQFNTIYYPGWKAISNGKEVPIRYDNPMGVIEVPVKTVPADVTISFSETPLRLFADSISVISLGGIFIISRKLRSKKNTKHE